MKPIMPFFRILFRQLLSNTLLTFALGAAAGGILEYYIGDMIDRYGFWGTISTLLLVFLSTLIFFVIQQMLRAMLPPSQISMGPQPVLAKGIIFILGMNSDKTAPTAYLYHRTTLQRVWFVKTDRTAVIADQLEKLWDIKCHDEEVEHHYNPQETAGAVQRAVTHALTLSGFTQEDLICDVTGGTTAMTVGAIQKCQELGIAMQMVPGQYSSDGRVEKPHEVIQLSFS